MKRGVGKVLTFVTSAMGLAALFAAAPEASATTLDVMFVVDGSGSIGSVGFADEKAFVENAITNILPSGGNAGAILFATNVPQNISLGVDDYATLSSAVAGWSYPQGYGYQKAAFNDAITDFENNSPAGDARLLVEVTDDGLADPVVSQSACVLAPTLQADNINVAFFNGNAPGGPGSTEVCFAGIGGQFFTAASFSDLGDLDSDLQNLVNQLDPPAPVPGPSSLSIFATAVAALSGLTGLRFRRRNTI